MAAPYRCDRVAGDSWRKDSAAALVLDLHMHMHACAPIQVDQRVLQVDDSLMQCIIRVRTSCRAASEAAERSSASPAGYPLPRGQPGSLFSMSTLLGLSTLLHCQMSMLLENTLYKHWLRDIT